MPNAIIPKKSSVAGKAPTDAQLATGELALNLKDGTLYFKDDVGVVKTLAMAGLLDSGVTPGTYGGTTIVPQIVVDAKGRVTSVTNQSIAFPVTSVFGRTGAVTLGSSDVTTALGFSPANASGANASGTWNNAADRLFLADTRGVNEAPADFLPGVHFDFKSNTTNGMADGGNYNGVLTLRKWGSGTENSGGVVGQISLTDNGNLWLRTGMPGNSWGGWKRIITADGTGASGNWNIRSIGQVPVAVATNTTSLYTNQWALVARATLPTQYLDVNVSFLSKCRANGGPDGTDLVNFRVKQQAAFGTNPIVELNATSFSSQRMVQYGYVIVQNTPTTIVDLYVKNNAGYNMVDLFEMGRQIGGGGAAIDYYTNSPYQTSVANIVVVDAKPNIHSGNLLSTLLTVDGTGSGLDADLLDGQDSAYFRNASNLNAGVVPNAQISGLYDGLTLKLNGGNTLFSTPNTGSAATNGVSVTHLASYRSGASAQTGAIVFIAPASLQTVMMQFNVRGLLYGQHVVDFIVQGYWNSTAWYDMRKVNYGSADIQVRWGRLTSTGQICLMLGDATTTWSYPHFNIVEALFSHIPTVTDGQFSNWQVGTHTDLSIFTLTPTVPAVTQIGSISGNAGTASRLATSRSVTVGNTTHGFDGTSNISFTLGEIGAPSTTGVGASGTWGISITGSAPWANITDKPTTLAGFGITDGVRAPYGVSVSVNGSDLNVLTTVGFYRGASLANAPDTGWWYVVVQSHDNSEGRGPGWAMQTVTAFGAGNSVPFGTTYTRFQTGGTTWSPWVVGVNASNVNTFAPTLTGTGASGTWGISITGQAGSLAGFVNSNINNPVNADNVTTNGISYANAASNLFGQTDGALYSQAYNSNWMAEIFQDYRSGQMAIRGKNNGAWNSWRTVLDSANFNTLAPTLTGTGASGTWGISVTGNAATATTATKLATARTINGVAFDGSANISVSEWHCSGRDFTNGTLITTSIDYSVSNGEPWILEIKGNSYGSGVPFDLQIQGYIYGSTLLNYGGYSNGTNISGMVALNDGGKLCFWFPRQEYWQGFTVKAYVAYPGVQPNRVTATSNVSMPAGATKVVQLSPNIHQSIHSGNYANYPSAKLATARTISLSGAATGSGSFDGSSNLNIALTTGDTDYGTL